MEIIRLNSGQKLSRRQIAFLLSVLNKGGVIAFPSETTYGLACDPRQTTAVRKIFFIKGRTENKPLQLLASSLAQVERWGRLNAGSLSVARRHWPGAVTLLVPKRAGQRVAALVAPAGVIGIRVSSSVLVRNLARAFGRPLAATSANRSGQLPAYSGRGVIKAFAGFTHQPDVLIDVGSIPRRRPSTVARIFDNGRIELVRQGPIRLTN